MSESRGEIDCYLTFDSTDEHRSGNSGGTPDIRESFVNPLVGQRYRAYRELDRRREVGRRLNSNDSDFVGIKRLIQINFSSRTEVT